MSNILTVLRLGELMPEMKKDHELPWVIRLGRWVFFVLGTLLAGGYVAHCFKEWFL
ncbi:hypothetical protein [uncultured Duodenibacillus sp.]|uniref:hypothetical protein n=1 Tax=uncultured Duodenibacillus sp. TaxID=1980699 RepID=UPI002583A8DE|nr:hypothetical protein [uncultured Duodenibacillus sp.]